MVPWLPLDSHFSTVVQFVGVAKLFQILFINAKDVYYITDGIKTVEEECYKCPAGREPMHECWKSYTKKEYYAMPRECRVCKPGFYKELPAYEYSYEKCILCTLCFGFIVAQDCDPRHGRICGDTCIEDFYLKHVRCQKCCKCMEGDMKEDGCKNSTTRKFCGSDSNGECKEKVKSLPLRSTQPNSTTQQSSTATAQITERNSKTSSSTIRPVVTMNADSFHTANLKTREMSSQGTLSTSYSTIYSQGELWSTKATTHVATKMRTEPVPRYTGPSIHTVVVKVSSRSLTMLSAILPYSTNLPQSSTPSPRVSNRLPSIDIICIVGVVLVFAILIGIVVKAKESGVKCCIGKNLFSSRFSFSTNNCIMYQTKNYL